MMIRSSASPASFAVEPKAQRNRMRQLANRAGFAAIGAIAAAPVLFFWGLVLHWKRRKARAELERREMVRRAESET